jgi:hypothetical protein
MPIPEIERQVVRDIDRVAFVVHEYENILSPQSLLATLLDLGGILFISLSHITYTINCISLTVDYNYHHQQSHRGKEKVDIIFSRIQ